MKQAGKVVDPPVFKPTEGMKALISEDERTQELLNQSKVTGLLLLEKTTMYLRLIKMLICLNLHLIVKVIGLLTPLLSISYIFSE